MTQPPASAVPYLSLAPDRIGVPAPGLRLPPETRVGGVVLQIADLDRSLDYYQRVLGLRRLPGGSGEQRSARLGAPGDDRALVELREQSGVRPVPRGGIMGVYHFALLLPTRGDLGRLLKHAHAQGVRPGASDHLFSEALYFTDPDGLTIEVYRDLPREDWVVSPAGEFFGVIDPIDAAGLVRAAGDLDWQGVPEGTTMGHMHFYVGDIPRAEEFYVAGLGFDKSIWTMPGLLFVSAGAYHHHVGLNTWAAHTRAATDDDARLVTWDLLLPPGMADRVEASLQGVGVRATRTPDGRYLASDPWGIAVRF